MRIEEININGIKCLDTTIRPERCNLLAGENGQGKTAVMQALQFAIEGRTSLGDRPEATLQLVRGGECSIKVQLADGFAFERSLRRDARTGSVSQRLLVSGQQSVKLQDTEPLVNAHVGQFSEMFDLSLFTGLSSDKQRSKLLDLCGRAQKSADLDVAGIGRRISMEWLRLERGPGTVAQAEKMHRGAADELIALLLEDVAKDRRESFTEILAEVRAEIAGELTESIGSALAKAKAIENSTKATCEQANQAKQRLTDRKNTMRVIAATVEAMKAERAKLIAQREEIVGQIENQKGREESIRQAETRLLTLDSEIKRMETTLAGVTIADESEAVRFTEAAEILKSAPKHVHGVIGNFRESAAARMLTEALKVIARRDALIKELESPIPTPADIKACEDVLASMKLPELPDLTACTIAANNARDAAITARTNRDAAGNRMYAADRAMTLAELQIEQHEAGPWARALNLLTSFVETIPDDVRGKLDFVVLNKLQTTIEEGVGVGRRAELDTAAGKARTECEAAKAAFEATERTLATADRERDAAIATLVAAQKSLNEAKAAQETQRASIESNRRTIESMRQDLASAESKRAEVERLGAELIRIEKNAAESLAADLTHKANNIRQSITMHEHNVASLDRKRQDRIAAEKALNELRSAGGWIPNEQLEQQRNGITDQVNAIDADIDAKGKYQALESELARAIADTERETVRHDVAKRVAQAIRAIRDGLMGELVRPLLDRINKFLAVAAPGCVAYCELEQIKGETRKPIFEIGWEVDGMKRVSLPALSGGEAALFGAGLAYALVCIANPPLRLLLIEAAEIDAAHMTRMLDALRAVSDDVGNIFVATCDESFATEIEGWNHVQLQQAAAAVAA